MFLALKRCNMKTRVYIVLKTHVPVCVENKPNAFWQFRDKSGLTSRKGE